MLGVDVRSYFSTLPHRVILDTLAELGVPSFYRALAGRILAAAGSGTCSQGGPRGMPIGLLTSQFFGNLGLTPVERRLRRERPDLRHVRYMDDLLVFGPSKAALWEAHALLETTLGSMGLELKPAMTRLRPTTEGIGFCGTRVFPSMLRLQRRSLVRFARRVRRTRRALLRGRITQAAASASLQARFSHAAHAQTGAFRRALVRALWP